MPHARQIVRDAVVARLTGQTAAGQRVFANRFLPARVKELPAILVYTLGESVDGDSASTAPRELTRQLELAVDGVVAHGESVDDAMDALALEIERALHADPFLGGKAADLILESTDVSIEPDGDRLVGRIALDYNVTYRTLATEPPADEDLDDFETAGVTYRPPGVHPDDAAHDEVVVQEVADAS